MRKLRKGLTWLSVLVFFLGTVIFYTQETNAAVTQDGSPDHPFVTSNRSIERYFFDKYKSKSEIASAWSAYQSFANKNDDSPYYIRLGDTSKLTEQGIALNSNDTNLKVKDGEDKTPLYVCWISKLKRASSSKQGTYAECATNNTGTAKPENIGGGGTYYNTFGYGIKGSKTDDWLTTAGSLGAEGAAFIWYDGVKTLSDHTRVAATKNKSGKINSFWMYTKGGEVGYVVYYVEYNKLYETLNEYNMLTAEGNQIDAVQPDETSKYARYDIYLNGAIALHTSGGWGNNSKTFSQNKKDLATFDNNNQHLKEYAEQNYNRHIKLHVLNGIPIVVRAWDITTNQIVSQTVGSSTDYYLQAFDSDLDDVSNSDGVYWDMGYCLTTAKIFP